MDLRCVMLISKPCSMASEEKRPRILFIMQMPPPIHGVAVMNMIIRQSRLVNESLHCDYINLATARDLKDLQKNRLSKYFHTLGIVLSALWKFSTRRYNYVYITVFPYGYAFVKDSIIVLLAKLFMLKPILHLHTYGFRAGAGSSPVRKRYYARVFRNTDVICLSEQLLDDIAPFFSGQVFILPNGIPELSGRTSSKQQGMSVNILYLSNLIRAKGILVLMDAATALKEKGVPFNLRVVGGENDLRYSDLEKIIAAKGLEKFVTLVGPRFGEEKSSEFRGADVFVFPSENDAFGLVLLEAMQFGVPCIATNIGAIPDILSEDCGLLVPRNSAVALTLAIEKLVADPFLRKKMGEAASRRYDEHFRQDVFEKGLIRILKGTPEKISTVLQVREKTGMITG